MWHTALDHRPQEISKKKTKSESSLARGCTRKAEDAKAARLGAQVAWRSVWGSDCRVLAKLLPLTVYRLSYYSSSQVALHLPSPQHNLLQIPLPGP